MELNEILRLKYPNADFMKDILLQDDGQGAYIKEWNLSDPKPTQVDLDAWKVDPIIMSAYYIQQKGILNKTINDKLDKIDLKSIRALRTNDAVRIADLEAQAASLRAQLK